MALPSARRPPEVDQLLKEETVKVADSGRLKHRINKNSVFMAQMVYWYEGLKIRGLEKKLSNKQVIAKAKLFAKDLDMLYSQLPNDWLRTLYYDHGLDFKLTSDKKKKKKGKFLPLDNLKLQNGFPYPNPLAPSSSKTRTKRNFDSKVIDLTDEPPPPDWLDNYMNGQKFPPRLLKTHTMSDGVTIVYYDYDDKSVKPEESEKQCEKAHAHDRDGVWEKC